MAPTSARTHRTWIIAAVLALAGAGGAALWLQGSGQGGAPAGAEIQTIRAGDIEIVVSAPEGILRTGRTEFVLQFQSATTGQAVDVGAVRVAAVMSMPGMVMSSDVAVTPTGTVGEYRASGQFGMAGAWNMSIEWDGPAGQGTATFDGAVR